MLPTDSIEVNLLLQLRTEADPITLQLTELELSRLNTDLPDCTITFIVSYADYKQFEVKEYLALDPTISQSVFLEELDPAKPLELEAILRRDLVSILLESSVEEFEEYTNKPAQAAMLFLQDLMETSHTTLFLSEASWGVTAVKQAMELPDDLDDGESAVKMGITTALGKQLEQATKNFEQQQQERQTYALNEEGGMYAVMQAFFEDAGLDCQPVPDEGAILLEVPGNEGEWRCYCEAIADQNYCRVYSVFPEKVPEAQRPAMAEFITRANTRLSVGNFEMRYESGELRFRTGIDVEGDRLSIALMKQLFVGNIVVMDQHFSALRLVLNGLATPEDALLLCHLDPN